MIKNNESHNDIGAADSSGDRPEFEALHSPKPNTETRSFGGSPARLGKLGLRHHLRPGLRFERSRPSELSSRTIDRISAEMSSGDDSVKTRRVAERRPEIEARQLDTRQKVEEPARQKFDQEKERSEEVSATGLR